MIKGGYILQPRLFDLSDASKLSPVTRELWFYILRMVNHSDGEKFKRGQNFFQFANIQEDLSWYVGYRKMVYSKPQITKALRRLCEGNMTATVKATRGIIITVCNYSYYQDPKNYEGNGEGSTKDQRRDLGGHTKNKNVKNERMKEQTDIPPKPKKPALDFKDYLQEKIIENNFFESKDKIFEFYNWRMTQKIKGKKQPYESEKGINGLFRDLNGCREAGLIITECLDIAMEKPWLTPAAKYFSDGNNQKVNGYQSRTEKNKQACYNFVKGAPDAER